MPPSGKRLHFETYHSALVCIKGWLETYLSTPVVLYRSMTLATNHQLVYVLAYLHKLTTLQDPAWDRTMVRKTVDLMTTCDVIVGIFERLKAAPAMISRDFGEDDVAERLGRDGLGEPYSAGSCDVGLCASGHDDIADGQHV
jgi:hypothetical protein